MAHLDWRLLAGGVFVIAGVNIGVGMLALPVVTAQGGLIPATMLYALCALFMVALARLILEACTWVPKGSHLVTITKTFLGRPGSILCWVIYLFLFYCLLIAHLAAGGDAVYEFSGHFLPHWLSTLVYLLIFAPVVYLGTRSVERLNMYLMAAIVVTFVPFALSAFSHLKASLLYEHHWKQAGIAIPAILAAFGFQNLVPTLYTYMDGDHKTLRKAIWLGTLIPLLLYMLWEIFTVGIIPKEDLIKAQKIGQSAIEPLQGVLHSDFVTGFAQAFATIAMSTSFIGMSIAFIDFWADGLQFKKQGMQHVVLMFLVFFIPLIAVFINPEIFIIALNFSGGIGEILLYGVLPVLFLWSGRYVFHRSLMHQFVPGGKVSLVVLFVMSLFVLFISFYKNYIF